MNLVNLEVKHKSFGDGVVASANGKYITVNFGAISKVFVYPDIFEKFMTLADGGISDEIKADLDTAFAIKKSIQDKKHEENLRAMTKGIVIPGKDISLETEDEENRKNNETEEI